MIIHRVLAIGMVILVLRVVRADETTDKPSENVTAEATDAPNDGRGWTGDGLSNVVETIAPTGESTDLFEGRTMCT